MNQRQFADRIGNIEDQLVEEARYRSHRRGGGLRRFLAAAVVAALMTASFTIGALAFSREVPIEQETIELSGIGLTLILPDSWKDAYGVEMGENADGCSVYVKSVHESKGDWNGEGYLFWVGQVYDWPMTPEELYDISPVPCRYLFSTSNATYSLSYASDVQWDPNDPEQEKEYRRMEQEASQIRFVVDNILAD